MSTRRGQWIARRGQADVAAAIDQVIDQQPRPGEQVQALADELIEDSPYQARQSLDETSLEELAQGMREVGFQGVLIVRPHGDLAQRRRGSFQLVYGHRRRAAWRRVCAERGEPCLLPVLVRKVSEERLLTIGAQENLQRQDLDPVEEAQLVAWHERMFFDKNQAEIGAMLGKSSDWVSVRSRIHKLPDVLKERLHQRPQAIKQMLEIGGLYPDQSAFAVLLANRVVQENLTVEQLRTLVRTQQEPSDQTDVREEQHNRRAGATSVQDITNDAASCGTGSTHTSTNQASSPTMLEPDGKERAVPTTFSPLPATIQPLQESEATKSSALGRDMSEMDAVALLQNITDTFYVLVSRIDELSINTHTEGAVEQAEQALMALRQAVTRRMTSDPAADTVA